MTESDNEMVVKFPDGTEKRVVGDGCIFDEEKETKEFAWVANGLKFRFPIGGLVYEFQMGKSDALDLKKWLNENLPHESTKILAVEGGGDWADASVDYMVNLTSRIGDELINEYKNTGGYHGNGRKWFKEWAIDKGYCREASDDEIDIAYDKP